MLQGTQFYVEAPTLSLASDNQAVYVVRKGDEWIEADKYQLMPQQGDNRQTLVIARKDKESGAITDIGSLRLDYKYDTTPEMLSATLVFIRTSSLKYFLFLPASGSILTSGD